MRLSICSSSSLEVVLGDGHILLADDAAGPRGLQPMSGCAASARCVDDLRRRVAVRGPVHLVLHRGEELLRHLRVRRVVHARRVNIQHLLVEAPLRRADVADALQQLVEVILLPLARRILQPLVVHGEALHQVLAQARRGPLAELRAAVAAHAVADGEDGVAGCSARSRG